MPPSHIYGIFMGYIELQWLCKEQPNNKNNNNNSSALLVSPKTRFPISHFGALSPAHKITDPVSTEFPLQRHFEVFLMPFRKDPSSILPNSHFLTTPTFDFIQFWRWYIAHRITGFLVFFHRLVLLGIGEHDVSETESVSVLRWRVEKTPTQLGFLERPNLNHWWD
jgi:hypothetical protein